MEGCTSDRLPTHQAAIPGCRSYAPKHVSSVSSVHRSGANWDGDATYGMLREELLYDGPFQTSGVCILQLIHVTVTYPCTSGIDYIHHYRGTVTLEL